MKISLNWIKEYTKVTLTPVELREQISVSLTEVESMEQFGDRFKDIVVAEVKNVETHPADDNLLVLKLDIGGKYVNSLVQRCPVKEGDKVPFLPPGTMIPGEIGNEESKEKVQRVKIKEVESDGVVPSGKELGLSHDHTTIFTVPEDSQVGTPFNQSLDLVDLIMEIKNKALTHRPDVFSIEGIAREVSAIQKTKYRPLSWLEKWDGRKLAEVEDRLPVKIVNEAKALCPRYMAVVLDNVNVKPSPQWMQIRLAKMGIRPVNNVVDMSNYLMMEVGQPSHTFDYDKVIKRDTNFDGIAVITVRMAKGGEKITTLDGQQKELYDDSVIIADTSNPIGIAGVMGGKDTEIDESTTRIIFQVENLNMYNVRKTSMKLGIFSDAVTRFSKGLDPNRVEPVLYRGVEMLRELTGASVASLVQDHYQSPLKPKTVTISTDSSRARIGSNISNNAMSDILNRLGLGIKVDKKNNTMTVSVPTYRRDLSIPQDIDEEVVRIYGYNKLKPTLPTRECSPVVGSESRQYRLKIKDILRVSGANEFYTYSFVGRSEYRGYNLSLANAYKLRNSVSPELSYMRPLILPSLIEKAPVNIVEREEYAGFEIDIVNPIDEKRVEKKELPYEPWHLGFIHTVSYYHAKKYLETVLAGLNVPEWAIIAVGKTDKSKLPSWIQYAESMYHPSRIGYIRLGEEYVGIIGQIQPQVCIDLKIPMETSGFEINVDSLLTYVSDTPKYRDPSKYPSVVHDFCFVVDREVPYSAIREAVREVDAEEDIVRDIDCGDIYVSEKKQEEKKVTIRVKMQSYEGTLDEESVEKIRSDIVASVKKKVDGKLSE